MKKRVFVIICFVALILGLTLLWFNRQTTTPYDDSNEVFCTLDAKLCPDGTGVGRSEPNCEFADCPETTPIKSEE